MAENDIQEVESTESQAIVVDPVGFAAEGSDEQGSSLWREEELPNAVDRMRNSSTTRRRIVAPTAREVVHYQENCLSTQPTSSRESGRDRRTSRSGQSETLRDRIEELEHMLAVTNTNMRDQYNNQVHLSRKLDKEVKRSRMLWDENVDLRSHNSTLYKAKTRYEHRLDTLETAFSADQAKALGAMRTGRWLSKEEPQLASELRKLQETMKQWSRRAGNPVNWTSLPGAVLDNDMEVLKDVMFQNIDCAASIVLNALLAKFIYERLFANPFWFLDHAQQDLNLLQINPTSEHLSSKIINEIYKLMQKADHREAHLWRSKFLQVLTPFGRQSVNKLENQAIDTTIKGLEAICDVCSSMFIDGPAKVFMIEEKIDQDKLRGIVRSAGKLSYELWQRPQDLHIVGGASESVRMVPFEIQSDIMEHHGSMRLKDEFDTRLDGQPIAMVIHPSVQTSGDDQGLGHEEKRILLKAVVIAKTVEVDERSPRSTGPRT